jgi:poly(A) polymerase
MVGPESPNGSTPQPAAKKYGITKPISIAGPTEADLQRNMDMEKFLIDSGLYESEEEAARRKEVLARIGEIVKGWVKLLTRQRGYTDQMVEDANAVIFTFGSYCLGVHGPGTDIDTLCVGPSYVNRDVSQIWSLFSSAESRHNKLCLTYDHLFPGRFFYCVA